MASSPLPKPGERRLPGSLCVARSRLVPSRILEVQILDVAAHVHYHKVKARKQLEAAKADAEGRRGNCNGREHIEHI